MADPNKPDKTIEMRLAEIEDKLAQMHITEEEMKAFQKVSSAMGMSTAQAAAPAASAQAIPIHRGINPIRGPIIRWNCPCICPCGPGFCQPCPCINECTCGPCACAGGGGGFGGGFGGFGM